MSNLNLLEFSQKSQSRWLDTWRRLSIPSPVRKKFHNTGLNFSDKLLQAYTWFQVMWWERYEKRKATETLAKEAKQVARHMKALFHHTSRSESFICTGQYFLDELLRGHTQLRVRYNESYYSLK